MQLQVTYNLSISEFFILLLKGWFTTLLGKLEFKTQYRLEAQISDGSCKQRVVLGDEVGGSCKSECCCAKMAIDYLSVS